MKKNLLLLTALFILKTAIVSAQVNVQDSLAFG